MMNSLGFIYYFTSLWLHRSNYDGKIIDYKRASKLAFKLNGFYG